MQGCVQKISFQTNEDSFQLRLRNDDRNDTENANII